MEAAGFAKGDQLETAAIFATLAAHRFNQMAAHIVRREKRDTSNWKWLGRWERLQK
jgi:hypothetical protein